MLPHILLQNDCAKTQCVDVNLTMFDIAWEVCYGKSSRNNTGVAQSMS